MNIAATYPDINAYWNTLKNASDEVKLELIARLSHSLLHSKTKKKVHSASHFYGVWKDSEPTDIDSFTEEIRKSRSFKDDIEAF